MITRKSKIFPIHCDLLIRKILPTKNITWNVLKAHIFNNLEPKFKEITHKVTTGETLQGILKQYQVKDKEIDQIKTMISKKINLNKLNKNNKISFVFDQSNNLVKEFTFQISNKEKLYLKSTNFIKPELKEIIIAKY